MTLDEHLGDARRLSHEIRLSQHNVNDLVQIAAAWNADRRARRLSDLSLDEVLTRVLAGGAIFLRLDAE